MRLVLRECVGFLFFLCMLQSTMVVSPERWRVQEWQKGAVLRLICPKSDPLYWGLSTFFGDDLNRAMKHWRTVQLNGVPSSCPPLLVAAPVVCFSPLRRGVLCHPPPLPPLLPSFP